MGNDCLVGLEHHKFYHQSIRNKSIKKVVSQALYRQHHPGEGEALNGLGWCSLQQHQLEEALTYLHQAQQIQQTIDSPHGLSITLLNLAIIYERWMIMLKPLRIAGRYWLYSNSSTIPIRPRWPTTVWVCSSRDWVAMQQPSPTITTVVRPSRIRSCLNPLLYYRRVSSTTRNRSIRVSRYCSYSSELCR